MVLMVWDKQFCTTFPGSIKLTFIIISNYYIIINQILKTIKSIKLWL